MGTDRHWAGDGAGRKPLSIMKIEHGLWGCEGWGELTRPIPELWRKPGYGIWQQQEPQAYCQPSSEEKRRNLNSVS